MSPRTVLFFLILSLPLLVLTGCGHVLNETNGDDLYSGQSSLSVGQGSSSSTTEVPSGSILVTWNADASGEDSFTVYRSTNNVDFVRLTDSPITTNLFVDIVPTASVAGTVFYYKVMCLNSAYPERANLRDTLSPDETRIVRSLDDGAASEERCIQESVVTWNVVVVPLDRVEPSSRDPYGPEQVHIPSYI